MKVCLSFSSEKARRILGKPKDCLGKKNHFNWGRLQTIKPHKLVLKDLQQTSVLEIWFFFSWVFNRGKQIQVFNQFSTKRFTTLMCWSINWYSDKPPFSLNVLIRLILSPKLCSWEVSAMSSLLSPAEPCSCGNHWAECIHCFIWPSASGLNWDLGWWAKDWTAMQKKQQKWDKEKEKKREGCFYNAKWSII